MSRVFFKANKGEKSPEVKGRFSRVKERFLEIRRQRSEKGFSPWKFRRRERQVSLREGLKGKGFSPSSLLTEERLKGKRAGFSPWRFRAQSAMRRFKERFSSKGPDPVPTSVLLKQSFTRLSLEKTTIEDIINLFNRRSYGLILFFFASLSCIPAPPVITSIIGLPLLFFSVQMITSDTFWLPKKIKTQILPPVLVAKGMGLMIRILEYVERVTHPRLSFIVSERRPLGIVILCFSLALMLPLPLTNLLPALGIAFISLGSLERDGVLGMIGIGIGLLGISITGMIVLSITFFVV